MRSEVTKDLFCEDPCPALCWFAHNTMAQHHPHEGEAGISTLWSKASQALGSRHCHPWHIGGVSQTSTVQPFVFRQAETGPFINSPLPCAPHNLREGWMLGSLICLA